MDGFFEGIWGYILQIGTLGFLGLIFGLLCVIFLIRQNILTWISGIIYVFISFVIFWNARLYGDFLLHIIFLILNVYGWYSWVNGGRSKDEVLKVTTMPVKMTIIILSLSVIGIYCFAQLLIYTPQMIDGMVSASLPYWDSTTSVLSVTGMVLTARKKIENWYYWLVVNILATGIYFYKELYFYALLYFIYIGLAIIGYRAWKRSLLSDG